MTTKKYERSVSGPNTDVWIISGGRHAQIDLNAIDKEFLKDVVGSAESGTSIKSRLAHLRSIAAELKEEGLTVTLSYKGDRLLTIGSEAKPKFSHLVTRAKAVEINNLRKLLELII